MAETSTGPSATLRTGSVELRPTFIVTDLKQFAYCPRVVYYSYCLPLIRPVTYKMEAGQEAHLEEEGREQRRSLRAYGLQEGERSFNLWLESSELGLRGRVDMVVRIGTQEVIPVEYKDSPGRAGPHWERQLAAYGLLLEEAWGLPVRRGFLYFIPQRRSKEVVLTAELYGQVRGMVEAMRRMVEAEAMPSPTRQRRKCIACEFRRFCNDV
jgi:CRISPR-associated exonuclease Cas4